MDESCVSCTAAVFLAMSHSHRAVSVVIINGHLFIVMGGERLGVIGPFII